MAKALANYKKLADDAEVRRDGFQARVDRGAAELRKQLDGHPNEDRILQTFEHYARAMYDLEGAEYALARYVELRDRPPVKTDKAKGPK